MTIDPQQAATALTDIDEIVRRVRQSTIYDIASQILILAGVLVFAGNVASIFWPRYAGYIWIAVNAMTVAGTFAIGAFARRKTSVHGFDIRALAAFVLFFAFGYLCSGVLGHYTPRQMETFWPIYFMLVYSVVGLWVGAAFVAIGLGIIALTLVGYFFAGDWFLPWMAVVNGGGLILGGLWMRRS
jgi:hypothetical protein